MAAGSYYDQDRTKRLLEIATTDTADDTFLDELGAVADQHIDNILLIHDEKIPLQGSNILNDVKQMAALYTAALYKGHRGDEKTEVFFMKQFNALKNGLAEQRAVEGKPYIVERFNSRFQSGNEHEFALWD